MPVSCNDNNKTQYVTFTLSLICRAEYPTFVNHMIVNIFSNTQGILLAVHMYIPRSLIHKPQQARYAWISLNL